MSKKRRDKVDELNQTGGLANTNCGIILSDIVATRSWTVVIIAILLMAMFFRAAIGLGGYSGTPITFQSGLMKCRTWQTSHVWRL